jgi:hypothetical protein
MPFRCKQAFPREEKCLLDLLQSVLNRCSLRVSRASPESLLPGRCSIQGRLYCWSSFSTCHEDVKVFATNKIFPTSAVRVCLCFQSQSKFKNPEHLKFPHVSSDTNSNWYQKELFKANILNEYQKFKIKYKRNYLNAFI